MTDDDFDDRISVVATCTFDVRLGLENDVHRWCCLHALATGWLDETTSHASEKPTPMTVRMSISIFFDGWRVSQA